MAKSMPKKIAILGGGGAAMTAAFMLTEEQDWQDKYEISVYQLGWRLGGKAATGRNPEVFDRVQEHGVHMLWGNYDNSFKLLRRLYEVWDRDPSLPFSSLLDGPHAAMRPYNQYILSSFRGNNYLPLYNNFEPNNLRPGIDFEEKGIMGLLTDLISFIASKSLMHPAVKLASLGLKKEVDLAQQLREALEKGDQKFVWKILDFIASVIQKVVELFDPATGDLILVAYWIAKGILQDLPLLLEKGWQGLDDWDLKDWLVSHGGQAAIESPTINFVYSGMFTDGQKLVAGTALYVTLRSLFAYKGSVMYKFKAGMAEAVFSPLYQVLKDRGVKFNFFHRVTALHVKGEEISKIDMVCQARPKDDYQPLYQVKGVEVWPSRPWYDQLVEGEALKAYDLESYDPSPFDRPLSLSLGKDFDQVILGISIGALRDICAPLLDKDEGMARMVERIRTTQTFSVQASLYPDLQELGYKEPGQKDKATPPNINEFKTPWSWNPVNNWQDFSEMLEWESWDKEDPANRPRSRAFFEGTIADYDRSYFPEILKMFVNNSLGTLWPKQAATNPGTARPESGVDWSLFWVPENRQDAKPDERIAAQWFPGISNPSDRYVQAIAGSTAYRLPSNGSRFSNLFLCGDWILTPLSLGSFESTIMAGIQASNAVLGKPLNKGIIV